MNIRNDTENLFQKTALNKEFTKTNVSQLLNKNKTIIYGAGELGHKIMSELFNKKIPFQIADDTKNKDGIQLFNTTIRPLTYYDKHLVHIIIVTIFSPNVSFTKIKDDILKEFTNAIVIPFIYLLLFLSDELLPWYLFDDIENTLKRKNEYLKLLDQLQDTQSKECLFNYLKLILTGESDLHNNIKPKYEIPFQLPSKLTYVDCGAYDGDTILGYYNKYPHSFKKIIAFEPDPDNYKNLQLTIKNNLKFSNISLFNFATCNKQEKRYFSNAANMGSKLSEDGGILINTTTLDNKLSYNNSEPFFIKMDVEGAELETLIGAETLIKSNPPMFAISVYHKAHDVLTIYEFLKNKGYMHFYLRATGYSGADILLFAHKT